MFAGIVNEAVAVQQISRVTIGNKWIVRDERIVKRRGNDEGADNEGGEEQPMDEFQVDERSVSLIVTCSGKDYLTIRLFGNQILVEFKMMRGDFVPSEMSCQRARTVT